MRVAVVGAGPAGSALAAALAARGHEILLVDRRHDPAAADGDRTIQLSLSPRGRGALERLGLADGLPSIAIPLVGRAFHLEDGRTDFRRYPDAGWFNQAVSRGDLTRLVLDRARAAPGVTTLFGHQCLDVLRDPYRLVLRGPDGAVSTVPADLVVGADGAASAVRAALVRAPSVEFSKVASDYGYREWRIEADGDRPRFPEPAIHIWPRRRWFLAAFPALDGSCRGTLVAPWAEWDAERAQGRLADALAEAFADVVPLLDGGTGADRALVPIPIIRCGSWHDGGRLVLVGDAAHATAPFMGQGVNLALEDAERLVEALSSPSRGVEESLALFARDRVPEGIACCDLSERAAGLLLDPPPDTEPAAPSTLSRLNFLGHSYAGMARELVPGWTPRIHQGMPPRATGTLPALGQEWLEPVELAAGEPLMRRGELADAMYFVESGTVRVEGPALGLVRLQGPALVGEMGWLGDPHRSAGVSAETEVRAARLTYARLEALCRDEPARALPFVRAVAALAIDRLQSRFHAGARYLTLLSTPGAADAVADFAVRHREWLAGRPLLVDAGLGARLEAVDALRPARWLRPLDAGGAGDLELLSRTGQLEAVLAIGFAEGTVVAWASALREPVWRTLQEAEQCLKMETDA